MELMWLFVLYFQNSQVILQHVESRPRKKANLSGLEFLLTIEGARDNIINVVKNLKQSSAIHDVVVVKERQADEKGKDQFCAYYKINEHKVVLYILFTVCQWNYCMPYRILLHELPL